MAIINLSVDDQNIADFGLRIDELEDGSGIERPLPEPRTDLVEIPGGNGFVDLSEALTGYPIYDGVEIKTVLAVADPEKWTQKKDAFWALVVGKIRKLQFSDDAGRYYTGRCRIEKPDLRSIAPSFRLVCDAQPFRYRDESVSYTDVDRYFSVRPGTQITSEGNTMLSPPKNDGNGNVSMAGYAGQETTVVISGLLPGRYFAAWDQRETAFDTGDPEYDFTIRVSGTELGRKYVDVGSDGIFKIYAAIGSSPAGLVNIVLSNLRVVGFGLAEAVTIDAGAASAEISGADYAYDKTDDRLLTPALSMEDVIVAPPGAREICLTNRSASGSTATAIYKSGVI